MNHRRMPSTWKGAPLVKHTCPAYFLRYKMSGEKLKSLGGEARKGNRDR